MVKVRIFFTSDVHASDRVFAKFLNGSKIYKANVAIIGGDITGKGLVLIEKTSEGYRTTFQGLERVAKREAELKQLISDVRTNGLYVHVDEAEKIEELQSDSKRAEQLLRECSKRVLEDWLKLAEERLKDTGVRCYISPGNDDILEVDEVLNSSQFVINPEEKIVSIDGQHEMITTGKANMTPWNCPRDVTEEELASVIERMAEEVQDMKYAIFNIHPPPYDSNLDTAPALDREYRPILKGGQLHMIPVGSRAVREAIEKYQPLLGLHGHVHESKGVAKIGRCLCLNPGSEYAEGILRGALIDLEDSSVKSYLFTSG